MAALAPLVLSRGTAADCDPLADLNLRAFEPSLFHQRLFARTDRAELLSWTAERLRGKLSDEGYEVWKAERGGALVGEAVWSVPNAAAAAETSGEDTSAAARNFPAGTNLELARVLLPGRRNIPEPHFCACLSLSLISHNWLTRLAVARRSLFTCGRSGSAGDGRWDGVAPPSMRAGGGARGRRARQEQPGCVCASYLLSGDLPLTQCLPAEGLSLYRRFGFEPAGEALRPESAPEIAVSPDEPARQPGRD